MTLYELSDRYAAFSAALESGKIAEEAIADTLDALAAAVDDKIDNIACLIKNLDADADAIDAEAKALRDRAAQKRAHADRLRQYLSDMLPRSGYADKRVMESVEYKKYSEAENAPSLEIDPNDIPFN